MAKAKAGILIHKVQVLKEWPPIKGKSHPMRNGNTKVIRKPNSLSIFFEIYLFITNLIRIPVSKSHLFQFLAEHPFEEIDFGVLKRPFPFS